MNGQRSKADREDLKGWLSHGEFGGMLNLVFRPASKTDFLWKETGALGEGTVQVFDYRVARENSNFDVALNNVQRVTVGFHGQVFIDSATHSVRRITMVADDLKNPPIHAPSISVDYDYIVVNDHDYLLPVGGQVSLRLGSRKIILNEIEFRDYRRFGSTSTILAEPVDDKRVEDQPVVGQPFEHKPEKPGQ